MAGNELREEALALLNAFFHEWGMVVVPGDRTDPGPQVDGLNAVQWLYDNFHKNYAEVEWAGFYVKRMAQWFCSQIPGFPLQPHNQEKNYRVADKYLWDTRFHAISDNLLLPFRDIVGLEMDMEEWGGIGLVVLHCKTEPDTDGALLRLQERLSGGPSAYTQRLREEGKGPRVRKRSFFVFYGEALYLDRAAFEKGFHEGWLYSNFQDEWRNSDKMPRNPKYVLDLGEVPDERLIARLNFNLDPEEFQDFNI